MVDAVRHGLHPLAGAAAVLLAVGFGVFAGARSTVLGGGAAESRAAESQVAAVHIAAAPAPSATVTWRPDPVVQGTIFTIEVAPGGPGIEEVRGELAGEPLHFESRDGAFVALAAAPIEASGQVELRVSLVPAAGRPQDRTYDIGVAAGDYRLERLTVAPRYGGEQPPEIRRRISEEAARARAVSARSHDTPRMWQPPFVAPRESRITSGFGHGRVFNEEVQSRHMGTDFAGAVGAPVRAPARGVVALVDSFYLGGNVIYIDHGAGLVTGYLHLSEQEVAEGEVVEPGQVIGRIGATGRVTGPHLHWIVRYGGITVDGMSLLALDW